MIIKLLEGCNLCGCIARFEEIVHICIIKKKKSENFDIEIKNGVLGKLMWVCGCMSLFSLLFVHALVDAEINSSIIQCTLYIYIQILCF